MVSLSCHVVCCDPTGGQAVLERIRELVHDRFGIEHVTVQVEPEGFEEAGACE